MAYNPYAGMPATSMIDPISAGLISGGIGLIGSNMTNQANSDIAAGANLAALQRQNDQNAWNADQAQRNRDFQEMQRSTQYQTAVQDLTKAGLNPMLAYMQGGAKPTGGAQATGVAAPVNVPAPRVNSLSNAIEAARNMSMNVAELALRKEQVHATNAQTEVNRTQGLKNTAEALEVAERMGKYGHEINVLKKTLEVQAAQIMNLTAGARASSAQAAKTQQETDLGIVSSNPITQGWGELKRLGEAIHNRFNPKMNDLLNRYDNRK